MRLLSTLALTLALPFAAQAAGPSCQLTAPDFTVFSLGHIQYTYSDFQGPTGALGNIEISRFQIRGTGACSTVVTGGDFTLESGSIELGGIESGGAVSLSHAGVQGKVWHVNGLRVNQAGTRGSQRARTANVEALPAAAQYLLQASRNFNALPGVPGDSVVWTDGGYVLSAVGAGTHAFALTTEQLANASKLRLVAGPSAIVVINVWGADATFVNKGLTLEGGIQPSNVMLNFANATSLRITAAGVNGSVLAPYANTSFTNGLITGGLYVGNLVGQGQVNRAPFLGWTGCNCNCPNPPISTKY